MIVSKVPGFLKKKRLLDDAKLSAERCRDYGTMFLNAGALADALDFFLKAGDGPGLEQLKEIALQTGDAYLLERILQAQGLSAPELWEQAAAKAQALGKLTLARWAWERAGKSAPAECGDGELGKSDWQPLGGDHADRA